MTKYIALHTITSTVTPGERKTATNPGKRPVTKDIRPGTVLVINDQAKADELLEAKAIRKATKDDTKDTHVEELGKLNADEANAAALEEARVNREAAAETKRREDAAAAAAKAGTPAKAKANAKVGKPAASAADAKDGAAGAAGNGGNKDGTGTNKGANTTADANGNAAGTDDGGLV